jgi:serine/threonine-protein kinase
MTIPDRLVRALADRYRIERELGAGGMATVYLAADLKHDRKVAIKVLKPELAAVLGAERFVVEIKTTAALSHPHILPLFDSGEAGGFLYYVMPYIQGETIRETLNRETQLGVDDAVRITREIADALDYAHRAGVIHRDIKPENILLHDGRAMVMDFGIALAVSAAAGGRMTETGLSLGTPHYMSPEQATAEKEISGRSDVYSLASVLYEMLTGQPPHVGGSAQQIIMKIITEPAAPVTTHRKSVPPHVAAAVGRALEKLPADRFASAREFATALNDRSFTTAMTAASASVASPWRDRRFLIAAAVAAVALIAAVAGWIRPRATPLVSRFSLALTEAPLAERGVSGNRAALSPDGRTLAWVSGDGTGARLWVRPLDQRRGTPLAGTEGATGNPSFSPDGKRIAFTSGTAKRSLRIVAVGGGPVLVLTDSLVGPVGVSWADDGYIYYDGNLQGDGLARIRETGGSPEIATVRDTSRGEVAHYHPSALPGGRGVLFYALGPGSVGVLDARTGKYKMITRARAARYVERGHLLTVTEDGSLLATPFDLERLELRGEPVLLAGGIRVRGNNIDFAVARDGTLLYSEGADGTTASELVWVTRSGVVTAVDSSWRGDFGGLEVSPDGRFVAVGMSGVSGPGAFVKRLDRGAVIRAAEGVLSTTWMPDGRNLLIWGPTTGGNRIGIVPADGSKPPRWLGIDGRFPRASPDGAWIVYARANRVLARRLTGDTSEVVLASDPGASALRPVFSPDGRWLAYVSRDKGDQLYVRPFPDAGSARYAIASESGRIIGVRPFWSPNGRELFWGDADRTLMRVSVAPGAAFEPSVAEPVFATPPTLFAGAGVTMAPDGRFLGVRTVGEQTATLDELVLVQGFFEELKRVRPK